jgi:hypothetical protein
VMLKRCAKKRMVIVNHVFIYLAHEIMKKIRRLKEKLDEDERIMIHQTEEALSTPTGQLECKFEKYLNLLKTKCLVTESQSSDPSLYKFIMREYHLAESAKKIAIDTLSIRMESKSQGGIYF